MPDQPPERPSRPIPPPGILAAAQHLDGADPASPVFGFGAILALGWPGGSSRGRSAASQALAEEAPGFFGKEQILAVRFIASIALLAAAPMILSSCRQVPLRLALDPSPEGPGLKDVSPASPSVGTTFSGPATIGTQVSLPGMTMALVGTGLPAGFPTVTPAPGHRFVSPRLVSSCHLSPSFNCRLGSFELIDSQGTRHSPAIAVTGPGFLPFGKFPGGSSIEGALVFMVPTDASPFTLRHVAHQDQEAFFLLE